MVRIAVRALIVRGDQLFLVRLKAYGGNPERAYFCTVGGGLNENEDIVAGLKREVIEETGVVAEVGRLVCVQQYFDECHNIEFFFHVLNAGDFEHIELAKTSHGLEEIAEIGFYDPKNLKVLPKFLQEVAVEDLLKGKEVRFFSYKEQI